jgi:hypothetical protein
MTDHDCAWQVLGYERWLPWAGTFAQDLWTGELAWVDTYNHKHGHNVLLQSIGGLLRLPLLQNGA